MREINSKPRNFWGRPEGKVGTIFGLALLGGAAYLLAPIISAVIAGVATAVQIGVILGVLVVLGYVALDKRFRNLLWYMYKSVMRFITGIFVQIDPIGIIESYVEDLRGNLKKMGKQISSLRGQMRKLKNEIEKNRQMIDKNLRLARRADEKGVQKTKILKVRKAGRLRDSNLKLSDLYKKMEVMYRVLTKMYENSEILLEDIQDEVAVRKREREAIMASHSAMESARKIISGDKDQRAMFDAAMESIADDVAKKVGEMEQFMEISESFMDSVDLESGVFEEKGLEMLERWEKEGSSFLLGEEKDKLIHDAEDESVTLDLDAPVSKGRNAGQKNQYSDLFNF